jgi:RNA polymerase sigma-70 factor, ECF subfamily
VIPSRTSTWAALVPTAAAFELSDQQLMQALREREQRALEQIIVRYGDALARAATCQLGDPLLADEVVQETMIGAWDGARRTRMDTPLRSWLFAILFNQCRKCARSRARRLARGGGHAPAIAVAGEPADPRLERLRCALATLDDEHRAVVVLRFLEDFEIAETARILAIPPGTVKSRTHYALLELRARLGEPP